jgi:hypothetical protein
MVTGIRYPPGGGVLDHLVEAPDSIAW